MNPFEETARAGRQLVQPGLGRPGYGGPQDWGAEAKKTGPYADPSRDTGGGDAPHLRRKTTFAPRTRPKPRVQTGDGWTPGAGNRYINPYVNPNKLTSGITGSNKFKQLQQWILNNQKESIGIGTASTLGPLSFLKGKEYLGDVSKINQWANMGYGKGNPVPEKMLSSLKGSWVPNKTFEKLGYGAGSLKDWWNKTISPKHFQPAQRVINPALKGLATFGKNVALGSNPMGWATTAALSTPSIINALTAREPGATESSLFGIDLTQNANLTGNENYQVPSQYNLADGGLAGLVYLLYGGRV